MNNAARMADFCYRIIVWMRAAQVIGAVLLILAILTHTPQLAVAGAIGLAAQLPKMAASRGLARYATMAEYSRSVSNWSTLGRGSSRRNQDYTRIWLNNRR